MDWIFLRVHEFSYATTLSFEYLSKRFAFVANSFVFVMDHSDELKLRPSDDVVYFGPFHVDCIKERLFKEEKEVLKAGRAMTFLLALLANPRKKLNKEWLAINVWDKKDPTTLADGTLNRALSELRTALDNDDPDDPRYILRTNSGISFIGTIGKNTQSIAAAKTASDSPVQDGNNRHPVGAVDRAHEPSDVYRWAKSSANAIWLEGAADDVFPVNRVHVVTEDAPYVMPDDLRKDRQLHESRVISEWRKKYPALFDGDCVRLVSYSVSIDKEENKHLNFTIGPMKWFDYLFANQRIGDKELATFFPTTFKFQDFVDLAGIAEGDLRASQLSNILPVYVSATTVDGYLVYSQRSKKGVGSDSGLLISAVSENLSPKFDRVFEDSSGASFYRAAARGIEKELSWGATPPDPESNLHLLGLGFDLKEHHPCLLFFAPLPFSRTELEQLAVEKRGAEARERKGLPKFVHLDNEAQITEILARDDWFPSGKASVIRALEFLGITARSRNLSLPALARTLSRESGWIM